MNRPDDSGCRQGYCDLATEKIRKTLGHCRKREEWG